MLKDYPELNMTALEPPAGAAGHGAGAEVRRGCPFPRSPTPDPRHPSRAGVFAGDLNLNALNHQVFC